MEMNCLILENHQSISHSLDICRITCSSFHSVSANVWTGISSSPSVFFGFKTYGALLCASFYLLETHLFTQQHKS